MSDIHIQSYKATLYTPLFYSSAEGRTIKTSKILSSTALSYAIGYNYFDLSKEYIQRGSEFTKSDYTPLAQLPFIATDMTPIDVRAEERTFRSTDYCSERYFTTQDKDIADSIDSGAHGIPRILGKSASISSWKTMRDYIGLSPGSEFRFTVATENKDLSRSLRFRMGIKRTGEFRAKPVEESDEVILNKYLLMQVYDVNESLLEKMMANCRRFRRGNDARLQHFVGVPTETFREVAEEVLR